MNRRGAVSTVAASIGAAALALCLAGAGVASADEATTDPSTRAPLPVPYAFFAGATQSLSAPDSGLAGANDWSCRPTVDKPRPVVLVHGTAGGAVTNWATYGPLLHNEGYCVFAPTYGALPGQPWPVSDLGGLSDITEVSVPQVGEFVDRVLAATGAEQVDLVGHSQGTLVAGLVAKHERPGRVDTVVSVAPLWHGSGGSRSGTTATTPAGGDRSSADGLVPALAQMGPGSPMLEHLWAGGTPYAPGVDYLNLVTRHEQIVSPYTSGIVEGPRATNVIIQDGCEQNHADHLAIVADRRTADFALGALDPGDPREPRCEPVAPYIGAVPPVPGS